MMPAKVIAVLLLVLLGCGTFQGQDLCKDVKKKGYKVNCPAWDDPDCKTGNDDCSWYEMVSCGGECGAGIRREARSRDCKYFDEEKNRDLTCLDTQERREKCKLECGANGFYNELLDFCQCKENFDGACCDQKIDACVSPVVKEGEVDRSIVHGLGRRCDARLRPSWYRFDSPAGNEIPTTCVPYGSCSTAVPFWINGTNPRPQDGVVTRTACGTQGDECCKYKLQVKVRNCNNKYLAYYLVPTQGCLKAYCVGSHEKCKNGESSETGFQPGCTSDYPKFEVTPSVGYHVDEQSSEMNEVFLTCSGAHPDAALYRWKAHWFFDGEPGPIQEQEKNDVGGQPKFYLPTTKWMSKMGTNARCTLHARHRDGRGTWSKGETKSAEYYLGIIVAEKVVNVKEGETAQVTLRPTVPVRCHKKAENIDDCKLVMSISLDPTARGPRCPGKPAEISQIIFHGDMEMNCGYKDIAHHNWHVPNKLQLKPKVDIQLDGTQTRTLRMRVNTEGTSIPDLWRGYVLPTVQVNILDQDDRGTCTMINDPHITTFDGRRYDFHDRPDRRGNHQIYVAYKHTKESEEVQARFVLCGSNIYCICGLAVRAGSSTVVFDRCRTGNSFHPELNYMVANAAPDPRMRVFQHNSGTQYHVFLPTGTQVKVYAAGGHLIWFEIKATVEAKKMTIGMCGNYNGDPKDDVQTLQGTVVCQNYNTWFRCLDENFRKSWHVPEGESIFEGKVPPHNPGEHMDELYCDCVSEPGHHGYEECDYHKRYEPCDEGFELFKPKKGYTNEEFPWLATYRVPERKNPAFVKAAAAVEEQYYSAWGADTWTNEKATEYCNKELFSSPAVTACLKEVPNQNYTSVIEACALDLVLTGSTEYAATHLESVKSTCNQELRMNLELWEPRDDDSEGGEEGEAIVGPPLRLMENLCPNECSGNGACIDSKCFCKKGFSSYDCSLKVDEVPVVEGVASSSVPCDRSSQDCSQIAVEGMKYLEGPGLTCHYYRDDGKDNQFFYSGPSESPALSTAPGNLFSLWVVQCQVPEVLSVPSSPNTTFYKLQVAVSNDGKQQSDRVYYASYDSKCETCVDKTCSKKDDSCIIGSTCYGYGEANPANKDLVCNPALHGNAWSPVSSLTSPTTPTQPTTPIDDDGIVCDLAPGDVSIHRDPKNCNMYYVCEGDRKHHMPCPIGLAFSEERGSCVEPNEVPGCS